MDAFKQPAGVPWVVCPPLRFPGGSGTIFFSHRNLRCIFRQDLDISWRGEGRPVRAEELAARMLRLQEYGCRNLNLVTPFHVVAQILEALLMAVEKGWRLPVTILP